MKNKILYVSSTVLLVIITSTSSAMYTYQYAQKLATIEKETAVKGAQLDLQERLSEEAIKKAEELVEKEVLTAKSPAQNLAKKFFGYIKEEKYDEAWATLSVDAQQAYRSTYGLKTEFANIKSLEIKNVEFRTSTTLSELTAVQLDIVYNYENYNKKNGEKTYFVRSTSEGEDWSIDDISSE